MGSTSEDGKKWKQSKKDHAKALKAIKFKDDLGPILDKCETAGIKANTVLAATKKPHQVYVICLNKASKTIDTLLAKMKTKVTEANKEWANCKKKLEMLKKTGQKNSREYSKLFQESRELGTQASELETVFDTLMSIRRATSSEISGVSAILKILDRLKY